MNFERPQKNDSELTTRTRGSAPGGSTSGGSAENRPVDTGTVPAGSSGPSVGDDSEITVISKKPPQQFCTSAFDWRKVGELLIGRQLGSFRLDSLLGVGGMGAVFQATDLQLHRQVAVKVLNSSENDPEAERRFRVEAQSAARLDHQNIARVFHVGQDQGWNYIVLELVEGQTLRQLVTARGRLSAKLAIHIFRQLASALDHAHQRNIIHRDIKPSNVLVTDDHSVKIVDMGLARIQRSSDSVDHDAEEGMTLGTFDYIAPEQARDARQADQQSDLYSLGCTLFYALVGRPPFADGTTIEKILSHSNSPRPSLLESRPDLPPSMERLVQHLMAPRREDRIGTARELEQRLADVRWEIGRSRLATPVRVSQNLARKRVPLMMIGVTLALTLVSLIWDRGWRDSPVNLPEWPAPPSRPTMAGDPENREPRNGNQGTDSAETIDNQPITVPANPMVQPAESTRTDSSSSMPRAEGRESIANREVAQSAGANAPNVTGATTTTDANDQAVDNSLFARPSTDRPFQFQTPDLFLPFLNRDRDPIGAHVEWWSRPGGTRGNVSFPKLPSEASERITTIQVMPLDLAGAGSRDLNDGGRLLPSTVTRVTSFSEAIESLRQYPNARRIELNFSGIHQVTASVRLASNLREIRTVGGQQPVLYFGNKMVAETTGHRSEVTVDGANLDVVGVAFAWETYGAVTESLFEISEHSRVTFKECTFQHVEPPVANSLVSTATTPTDRPVATDLTRAGGKPSWIRIEPAAASPTDGLKQGSLTLNQCSMHGPVSGVEVRSRESISLLWTDSRLSTLESAIVLRSQASSSIAPRFDIQLERSSLFARRGIVAFATPRLPRSADVSMFAQDCLLVAADPSIGLLHHDSLTPEINSAPSNRELANVPSEDWRTFAESSVFFEGFNNLLMARYLWTVSADDGTVSASADAIQIRSAKWFQQDLAQYRSVSTLIGNDLSRLMGQPASERTWTGLYAAIGQEVIEHGAPSAHLSKFPTIAAPVSTQRP
ncbi:MAG: serine/threonine-protein kinase [Pirellulaceae bacterium]|nr:serine/threonine-protein kinase [Pirellulaceae bacterium]